MKRRLSLKTGLIAAGSLVIPNKCYGLENRIIDTLSEKPVEGASVKYYEYPDGKSGLC